MLVNCNRKCPKKIEIVVNCHARKNFGYSTLKLSERNKKSYQAIVYVSQRMITFLRFRIKESKKSSHQDRHSSSVDRSLSPRLEGKSFYDGGSRGTPPSMAIQAGIKPHSTRELQYNNKKKKKGWVFGQTTAVFTIFYFHQFSRMMEKIWSKFNKKKEGEERVGTPVGHWTMNRSFSPTKSDSESNKLDSLQNLKSTPGRKSIG